jgi:hypothetical protein
MHVYGVLVHMYTVDLYSSGSHEKADYFGLRSASHMPSAG